MPYVAPGDVPDQTIFELATIHGPGDSWRRPLVATESLRVILLGWPVGYETVPHVHLRAVEVFHVLEGRAEFEFDERQTVVAGPGSLLVAPPNVRHFIRVVGSEPLLLLAMLAPNVNEPDETIEFPLG